MAKPASATNKYDWPAIGNEKAIDFLDRSLKSGKLVQTYLFIGPEDLGKSTVALAFARNLQGDHQGFNSDLYILEPDEGKKNIGIEAVREFIKKLHMSSFMNSYKIGLIKEAELLSPEAKSALLKTLEEPEEKVIIILLVKTEEDLPATILSRSQKLYFYSVPATIIYDYLISHYGTNRSLAKELASLALGRPLRAIRYLENAEAYKQYLSDAEKFLALFAIDANERLKILDTLFTDRSYSRQASDGALEILLMAEGLLRDLLMLNFEQRDKIQHLAIIDSLEKCALNFSGETDDKVRALLASLKLIAQGKEYLVANVNPRLILEQLVINL